MSSERVRFERDGDVGLLTLADPPLNLFGRELMGDLDKALARAESEDIRALLVSAEGELFTGGADVNVFHGLTPEGADEFTAQLLDVTHRIEGLPFPVLASVHGLCLTAGFELALACDMIWASESARFGKIEIVLGLTPLMGGTQRVAERSGPARARELVMSGGLYEAATLERWNVINRVVPDADLAAKSLSFAKRLAAGPTVANAATKRVVRAFLEHGVRGADERVAAISSPLFASEDLQRAVETFLEEGPGKATFEGR
ncbi:MAG TPA: enoyl-CoA hydratase/isomerase family protein [Thermoleophilaceae bacterium]|nr:enoyl-CoA hydratase/isomerase family protein [Thermoleophilaceae bacterium]